MPIRKAHAAMGKVFFHRCFYLFLALILLIPCSLLVEPTPLGRMLVNIVNVFLMLSVAAAVGRSIWSFVLVLLLAAPYAVFHWRSLDGQHSEASLLALVFGFVLYIVTLGYLLRYVFRREVMTTDKLFGAAAAYLLSGVLWAYIYALIDYLCPHSFLVSGAVVKLSTPEVLYFSFTVLTSTGFGDIIPLTPPARAACILEQAAGALFVAILIARLVGVYAPRLRGAE